ncbi:DUF4144 domain-containing protein [Colwellia sp. 4_MG-2023]|uniref:DUF4144 domain-containing protein n=1 Tax=unclassified Colwellia TaxID=196834 RepID=UPI001C0A3251|nr:MULTISPECIES: DUF4144 domain-containing protein [unclassified Colwellia]MBU2923462.1 DUF4144 domain-containing protein [Colwellia sp. C2M11]MDO6508142.1 DUF4144 domain-containing protein [Colwellia sp. 5_MG-2023]MDO6556834.1 DUF4144 domain-containing protein [Colwellia sp. 4_MG-2023]MDO6653822.1 DUF4144 domain-containing protein [Colwellia sp. 3_MG-2023]MDO6666666.1 DUF4144 domain-containing protein [Colwellia sp. 2_MG-2023]
MISWPCMLKLDGDDELIYLDSFQKFNLECSELIFTDDDYVIDASGNCYLIKSISGMLDLIANDIRLSIDEVVKLVRAHEFNKVSVCLTKINFLTVSEAIHSLNY